MATVCCTSITETQTVSNYVWPAAFFKKQKKHLPEAQHAGGMHLRQNNLLKYSDSS